MSVPVLDGRRVDAYLARLGSPAVQHDAAGLATLQAAHLMAVPFHNLLLLANDGRPWDHPPLEEVVDGAIAGVGGNCDRTTPPFAELLRALGFDARLAAATVREPGDHFVCVVHTDGRRYLCDVGNGHPYLRPWDLDGAAQEQCFHGWRFRFDPRAPGGPTLVRDLGGGADKTVYRVDPTPRRYDDFAPMVRAHYTELSFGPFLSGLRAVSIQSDAVLTLRDGEYARATRFGRFVRPVGTRDAAIALLVARFALPTSLVEEAVAVAVRRRPDLFGGDPPWLALGYGRVEDSALVESPKHEEVPDVLVSLASVGRGSSVRRLLRTLVEEVRASRYPGRVGVLIVDNHPPARHDGAALADHPCGDMGVPVHHVPIEDALAACRGAVDAGLIPPPGGPLPLSVGVAREAQVAALRGHLASPLPGLPHPSAHPTVVWMVDEDITFQQLDGSGALGRHTSSLFRVARYWRTLPQHAVVLGTFTGDPPVPGLDCLAGQLADLAANVGRLLRLGPGARWAPPPSPPPLLDAYYDLSESPAPDADAVWPYGLHLAGRPVREVAGALLGELPRLLEGRQVTRPLSWDGREAPVGASLRRGGNTVFLDFDALFRWPTPVLTCGDGVVTRRADSLWAALAQAEDPAAVVEATLPVWHGRAGQTLSGPGARDNGNAAASTAAQVRGVVLARALSEGREVATELSARELRVVRQRNEVRKRIAELMGAMGGLTSWMDPAIERASARGRAVLHHLDGLVAGAAPLPGDPAELEAFVAGIPEAVTAWRGAW